jgi:uncharacterized protein with GYD domain
MHHYIVLGKYTDQGLREMKGKPKSENARRILERLGGKMQLYYTLGEYDFVAIVDMATEGNMLRFLSEIDSLGYVRSTALKAWSETEVARLLAKES